MPDVIITGVTTSTQLNNLIGAIDVKLNAKGTTPGAFAFDKVIISGATGLLEASSITKTELEAVPYKAGTDTENEFQYLQWFDLHMALAGITAPGAASMAGYANVYIDSTTKNLASHYYGGSVKSYPALQDANTFAGVNTFSAANALKFTDSGIAASCVLVTSASKEINTNATTVTELEKLHSVTAGTLTESKAIVVNGDKHIDELNVATLKIGATGATVAVNATATEINQTCNVSARIEVKTTSGAITQGIQHVDMNNTTGMALTIADAKNHLGFFTAKAIAEPAGTPDHSITLTIGTWDGTNTIATFQDLGDFIMVRFDSAGNGTVILNNGVTLS